MTGQHRCRNVMIGQYRFYNFGLGFNPVRDEGSTAYCASPSQRGKCSKKNQNAPSLHLLSIPQSVGKNVKTFRWDQRLLKENLNAPNPSEHVAELYPVPSLSYYSRQANPK